eukprot:gene646-1317_t
MSSLESRFIAEVANKYKLTSPRKVVNVDKDREALVRSLNERILSLEKQLNDKQFVIERLLDNSKQITTNSKHETPVGNKQDHPTKDQQNNNKETTEKFQASSDRNKEDKNIGNKCKGPDENNKKPQRKRVTIVGDSILKGIYEEGMQKVHNVKIKPHSGATTTDIVDYIKPVVRRKPDCIILHAGTNDLTSNEDTLGNLTEIIDNIKSNAPETVIVLSNVVIREDKQAKDKKVSVPELNIKLKEFAKEKHIQLIDNSNLDRSCLSRKKLHLNEKDRRLGEFKINRVRQDVSVEQLRNAVQEELDGPGRLKGGGENSMKDWRNITKFILAFLKDQGWPITDDELKEVAELSGVLEHEDQYLPVDIENQFKQIIADPKGIKPKDCVDAYLYLKHEYERISE